MCQFSVAFPLNRALSTTLLIPFFTPRQPRGHHTNTTNNEAEVTSLNRDQSRAHQAHWVSPSRHNDPYSSKLSRNEHRFNYTE